MPAHFYFMKTYKAVEKWYNKNVSSYEKSGAVLMKQLLNEFIKFIPPKGRILDAGSGIGQDTDFFSKTGFDAYGIDFSKNMLARAAEKGMRGKFMRMNIMAMRFPDKYFDGIWISSVLTHLKKGKDLAKGITETRRVLKPGGIAGIIVMKERGEAKKEMKNYVFNQFLQDEILYYIDQGGLILKSITELRKHGHTWFFILCGKKLTKKR